MHRAIVSGITGHLGTALSGQLAAVDIEVHGLTRQDIASATHPKVMNGVRLHQFDGRTETVVSIFERIKPNVVVHLAALARREHLITDVSPFVTANVLFGTQLLEAAKNVGCRTFITTGSYLQHGENGSYRPFNLYAATKNAFEEILSYYVAAFGFSASVLTLCNVYSEFDIRPTLLTQMAAAYADGTPLSLHAREAWVDLVHVEDVAGAITHLIRRFRNECRQTKTLSRYSVSSGRDITCSELMGVFEAFGLPKPTVNYGQPETPSRRVRPWRGICVPGWTPRISIQDGVARLLARRTALAKVTEEA